MLLHPLQDLFEAELLEPQRVVGACLDLGPRDRRGDVRQVAPPQELARYVVELHRMQP